MYIPPGQYSFHVGYYYGRFIGHTTSGANQNASKTEHLDELNNVWNKLGDQYIELGKLLVSESLWEDTGGPAICAKILDNQAP